MYLNHLETFVKPLTPFCTGPLGAWNGVLMKKEKTKNLIQTKYPLHFYSVWTLWYTLIVDKKKWFSREILFNIALCNMVPLPLTHNPPTQGSTKWSAKWQTKISQTYVDMYHLRLCQDANQEHFRKSVCDRQKLYVTDTNCLWRSLTVFVNIYCLLRTK